MIEEVAFLFSTIVIAFEIEVLSPLRTRSERLDKRYSLRFNGLINLENSQGINQKQILSGKPVMAQIVFPVKPSIAIEDLDKVDIRVGKIRLVEEVPKSDKLVRLTVDFGGFERKILAGLKKERVNPGEIQGRQALFVVNMAPRKIMGEISEGMLFDIGYSDGIVPVLAVPEKEVPNGVRAG
jgi:tRNA-binding protein